MYSKSCDHESDHGEEDEGAATSWVLLVVLNEVPTLLCRRWRFKGFRDGFRSCSRPAFPPCPPHFPAGFPCGISLRDFPAGFPCGISLRDFPAGFPCGISLRAESNRGKPLARCRHFHHAWLFCHITPIRAWAQSRIWPQMQYVQRRVKLLRVIKRCKDPDDQRFSPNRSQRPRQ